MHRHRLARTGVAMLLMAGAGALAGCSFDPYKDDTVDEHNLVRAGRLLSQAETRQAVPSASEAPAGYALDAENTLRPEKPRPYTVLPARCDAIYRGIDLHYVKARTRTYQTFVNSDKTYLGVGVSSRQGTPAGISDASSRLEDCRKFTVQEGKRTIRLRAAPLPFPKMGEASLAIRYTVRFPALKGPATYDAVRIVAGHNTLLVDALSLSSSLPVPGELKGVADDALLNLSR